VDTDTKMEADTNKRTNTREEDEPIPFGFVTVSSSRDEEGDESGDVAKKVIREAGHAVEEYRVVNDDEGEVRGAIEGFVGATDAVVTSGGTGLTHDDVTVETLRPMFDKEIPGFGEEFRRRSVEEVGTAAILSRATAGVVEGTPVFVLPGSPDAVETGLELALAEVGHVLALVGD